MPALSRHSLEQKMEHRNSLKARAMSVRSECGMEKIPTEVECVVVGAGVAGAGKDLSRMVFFAEGRLVRYWMAGSGDSKKLPEMPVRQWRAVLRWRPYARNWGIRKRVSCKGLYRAGRPETARHRDRDRQTQ